MKEFQYILNNYLLNRGKQKKYLAFVLALSMLVSFAVPLSLIQPADSMTVQTSPLGEQLSTDSSTRGPARPAKGDKGHFTEIQTQIPENAENFGDENESQSLSFTLTSNPQGTTDINGDITIQAGSNSSLPVSLVMTYTMLANTISTADPCIYYRLPDGITIQDGVYVGELMTVKDQKYPYNDKTAGYFTISAEGLIVIQFTDAYIEWLKNNGATTYSGDITFVGTINRDDNADGDQILNIGGTEITVVFNDTVNQIEKNATVTNDGQGNVTIQWTVTVTDAGFGLGGWTVTDGKFATVGTSAITVDPSNLGFFNDDGSYTFYDDCVSPDDKNVTFTYSETISATDLNSRYASKNTAVHNDATISKDDLKDTASKDVYLEQTKISKIGEQDYQSSGVLNNKIDWTVVIENPYGASLKDYVIHDTMLEKYKDDAGVTASIKLTNPSGNDVTYTNNGDGTLTITGDSSKVTLTYQTPAVSGSNPNSAKFKYPGGDEYSYPANEDVNYNNPYSVEKVGTYDAENNRVIWKVTVKSSSDSMTLDGIELTDGRFSEISSIDFDYAKYSTWKYLSKIEDKSTSTVLTVGDGSTPYATATLKDGKVVIADDGSGVHELAFTYATTLKPKEIEAGVASNEVYDQYGHKGSDDVELTNPYTLNKTGTYDAANNQIVWKVTVENTSTNISTLKGVVLEDDGFANMVAGSLKVTSGYYNNTYLQQIGDMTNNVITVGSGSTPYGTLTLDTTITEDHPLPTIEFANSSDSLGLKKVEFEYRTQLDEDQMIAVQPETVTNTIVGNKWPGEEFKGSATPYNPYELYKTGTYNAEKEQVTWEIHVRTVSGGSVSLDGVELQDSAFVGLTADNINITYAAYNGDSSLGKLTSSGTIVNVGKDNAYATLEIKDDTIKIDGVGDNSLSELKFTYTTEVTKTMKESGSTSNGVGDNKNNHTGDIVVPLTNPYTLDKSGQYDPESGKITWTVVVKNTGTYAGASLNGTILYDAAFSNIVEGSLEVTSANYNGAWLEQIGDMTGNVISVGNGTTPYGTLTLDTTISEEHPIPTITFANASDTTGLKEVTFTYQTVATDIEIANKTASNDITSNRDVSDTADAEVRPRNEFEKELVSSEGANLVYGNADTADRTLNWVLEMLKDDGYAGAEPILVDQLNTTYGRGDHYITEEQANDIVVSGKANSNEMYSVLTAGVSYSIKFYDASNKEITSWTIDNGDGTTTPVVAKKFEIAFYNVVDNDLGYRYIKVDYSTTANVENVTVGSAADGVTTPTQEVYTNTATFDGVPKTPGGYTFTRWPGDYVEKIHLTLKKQWPNTTFPCNSVTVQLWQRVDGSDEWILYDTVEIQKKDDWTNPWTYSFDDLPKTPQDDRTKQYYYKAVEITEVDGYEATYSCGDDGVTGDYQEITITNKLKESCDKVALGKNGKPLENGTTLKPSDLIKTTIDGKSCYVIGWQIYPSQEDMTLTDTLPKGFKLCTAEPYNPTGIYVSGAAYSISYNEYGNQNTYKYGSSESEVIFRIAYAKSATYYTYITIEDYDNLFSETVLSEGVVNTIVTANGNSSSANVVVTPNSSSTDGGDLLTKEGTEGDVPGLLKYTILVNPDGKTLSNDGFINITDDFDITKYISLINGQSKELTAAEVAALNANLASIKVENVKVEYDDEDNLDYDVVGDPLNSNQYSYTVEYKPTRVDITEYEFTTEDNHKWKTVNCTAGEVVTLVLDASAEVSDSGAYKVTFYNSNGDSWPFSGIDINSNGTYKEDTKQWTVSFTVPTNAVSFTVADSTAWNRGYTLTGVSGSGALTTQLSTTTLNLSVPDATPLLITYEYEIKGITLNIPDSYIDADGDGVWDDKEFYNDENGNGEWDAAEWYQDTNGNGQYDPAEILLTDRNANGKWDDGDKFSATNSASFDTGNANATDSSDKTDFIVIDALANVSANNPPLIEKADTNDYVVKLSDATFKLAKYTYDEASAKWGWQFAVDENLEVISGVETYSPVWEKSDGSIVTTGGNAIPNGAHAFKIGSLHVNLETGTLYKLIEVSVPLEYEGSNLEEKFNALLTEYLAQTYTGSYTAYLSSFTSEFPGVTSATFEQLLQMHLKGYTGGPFDHFFKNFQSTFYFTYTSEDYDAPSGFAESVMTVPANGTLTLTNSKLIDVSATKTWDDKTLTEEQKANASVQVKLYWSNTKKGNGFPSVLNEATAQNLGLVGEFSNPLTITNGDTVTWTDLPSGINGKPIYYYVKEVAYTIDNVTYNLVGNEYVSSEGDGEYKPIYVGNSATGKDATVSVVNTKGLALQKVWRDINNNPLPDAAIPLPEVPVNLYGTDANGKTEFIKQYTLTSPSWSLLIEDDLSKYTSFTVSEALESDKLYGYSISYVYNTNGAAGTIQIINKDTTPTEIKVTATKQWDDEGLSHDNDAVVVDVYRTTRERSDNGIGLEKEGATPLYANVILSANNNWTMEWADQPAKDENGLHYHYYIVEEEVDGYKAVYSRVDKAASQSITIKNVVRGTLTINKTWKYKSGDTVTKGLPASLKLEVYRSPFKIKVASGNTNEPATTDTVKIMAMGDSITHGHINEDHGYRKYFYNVLVNSYGYNINMVDSTDGDTGSYVIGEQTVTYDADHEGHSGYAIIDNNNKYNKRSGLYEKLKSNGAVKSAQPDIILLMIGTNDILDIRGDGYRSSASDNECTAEELAGALKEAKEMKARLNTLLDYIYNQYDDVSILIMNPTPIDSSYSEETKWVPAQPIADQSIEQYTTDIQSLVTEWKADGYKCEFVDINAVFAEQDDYTAFLNDYCHPSEAGYKLMGEHLADVVHTYLRTGSVELGAPETVEVPTDIDYFPSDLTSLELYGEYTINAGTNWTLKLDDVEKAASDGTEYVYYVKEKEVDGWIGAYAADAANGQLIANDGSSAITLNNTKEIQEIDITVKKTWMDVAANRPTELTLHLERSTDQVKWTDCGYETPDAAKAGDLWTYIYEDLPGESDSGEVYYYRVVEDVPDGYHLAVEENNNVSLDSTNPVIKLTNKKVFNLKVIKQWADGNPHAEKTITIKLYRSTEKKGNDDTSLILNVTPTSLTLGKGGTQKLVSNRDDVSYTTDSKAITVDTDGTITAISTTDGTPAIVVAKAGGQIEKIEVTVVDTLTVNPNSCTVIAGKSAELTATLPITGHTWNSDIANIEISSDKKTITVTGVKAGEANLVVTDGTNEFTVPITVEPALAIDSVNAMIVGDELTLTANKSGVTWAVTEGDAITVDANGNVKALDAGTATVQATLGEETATVSITVNPFQITNGDTATINIGEELQLNTNRTSDVTWSSDSAKILVDADGKVTLSDDAAADDTATITATYTANGQTYTDTIEVMVAEPVTSKSGTTTFVEGKTYFDVDTEGKSIQSIQISGLPSTNWDEVHVLIQSGDGTVHAKAFLNGSWSAEKTSGSSWQEKENPVNTYDGYTLKIESGKFVITFDEGFAADKVQIATYGEGQISNTGSFNVSYNIDFVGSSSGGGNEGGGTEETVLTQSTDVVLVNDTWTSISIPEAYHSKEIETLQAYFKDTLTAFPDETTNGNFYLTDLADGVENDWIVDGNVATKCYKDGLSGAKGVGYCTKYTDKLEKFVVTYTDGSTYTINNTAYVADGGDTGGDGGGDAGSDSDENVTNVVLDDSKTLEVASDEIDLTEEIDSISIKVDIASLASSGWAQFKVNVAYQNGSEMNEYVSWYEGALHPSAGTVDDDTVTIDIRSKINKISITKTDGDNITILGYSITYASTEGQALSLRPTLNASTAASNMLAAAATKDAAEVEFDENGVAIITLNGSDIGWEMLIENLDACDENGIPYYYWIVEDSVSGFSPSYKFEDGEDTYSDTVDKYIDAVEGDATATVKNTRVESGGATMPSTGGTGTQWYYIIGMMTMLMGTAGFIGLKLRQRSQG